MQQLYCFRILTVYRYGKRIDVSQTQYWGIYADDEKLARHFLYHLFPNKQYLIQLLKTNPDERENNGKAEKKTESQTAQSHKEKHGQHTHPIAQENG